MCRIGKAPVLNPHNLRRDAGVDERGGLENRCALTGTGGSNPPPAANCGGRVPPPPLSYLDLVNIKRAVTTFLL